MDAKLTLKLDNDIIEKAKKYAADKKLSLSRLIENYLDSITRGQSNELEISPFVKSISGGKKIPLDIDHKREYYDHLEKKHQ